MPAVSERVAELVKWFPEPRDRWEQIAARRLFSTLAQFEDIAVLAAERGDGTDGQLEDELVHRETFAALARSCGGMEPPAEETIELVDRLTELHGPVSLALLNLVAEQWLETVFGVLGRGGWAADLFRAVEQDECRHVADAWNFELPSPDEVIEALPAIERALAGIGLSPGFALPVRYLFGVDALREIGKRALERHAATCATLGVYTGPAMRRLTAVCRAQHPAPRETPATGRHLSLIRAHTGVAPVWTQITVPGRLNTSHVAARCLRVLRDNPELCLSFRRETIYQHDPCVAVRVGHPEGIATVVINSIRQLRPKTVRVRSKALPVLPRLDDTMQLLPAAVAPLAITSLYAWRFAGGYVPLFDAEGIPAVVAIGRDGNDTVLAITMDHRIYDAPQLAALRDGLKNGD